MKIMKLEDARKVHIGLQLAQINGLLPDDIVSIPLGVLGDAIAKAEADGKTDVEVGLMDALWAAHDTAKAQEDAALAQAIAEGR